MVITTLSSTFQHPWRRRRRKDCDCYPLASSMNTFLSCKKNRPRQSSVSTASELGASKPYEELAPSPHSPIHVGMTSQALCGSVPNVISAPITNPTLMTDGTKLNLFTMHRSKQEQDQLYNSHPATRQILPLNSPSTAESSTLYSESDKTYSHHRSTMSVSETLVSSGRSPSISDFGGYHQQRNSTNQQTTRPTSRTATRSDRMSTNTTTPDQLATRMGGSYTFPLHFRSLSHHSPFLLAVPGHSAPKIMSRSNAHLSFVHIDR